MKLNIVDFRILNKDDIDKMIREDELLTEIAIISSLQIAKEYKKEFHSNCNVYCFNVYLNKLERIKGLLIKGFNDVDLVIRMIKTNSDYLI